MQKKKGISLIVLVITIIVMIILAAAIILALDNAGIINNANKAVQETDLAQAKHLAALKWAEAYLDDSIIDKEGYVKSELAKQGITEEDYKITFTENGVDVELKDGNMQADVETPVPEEWSENVVKVINGVPIPKGFVASPYAGEKTKDGGLVIYELASGETAIPSTETYQTSLTTRNQYVWIPVEDFFEFVRRSYDGVTNSNSFGESDENGRRMDWEVIIDLKTNLPFTEQDSNYMTSNTLAEVQAMYQSVKEYKGFYIARYEAGIDEQRTEKGTAANLQRGTSVYSRMNKIPYTHIPWTWNDVMNEDANGAVEVARSMYPVTNTNYGVVSTLTYGVQWDAVLKWWLDVNAKDIAGNKIDLDNSTNYGNYREYETISLNEFNEGAKYAEAYYYEDEDDDGRIISEIRSTSYEYITSSTLKEAGSKCLFSTGALKAAKVNNIYDMAGNLFEWTMEGNGDSVDGRRATCGGSFWNSYPVSGSYRFASDEAQLEIGFRSALYIKK